jgi:hypothetical protein
MARHVAIEILLGPVLLADPFEPCTDIGSGRIKLDSFLPVGNGGLEVVPAVRVAQDLACGRVLRIGSAAS